MRLKSTKNISLILLLCVASVACTNSKLVLRPLYNSLDNRLEKRFLAYADFDQSQTQQIKELVDHFHLWHRQTQLESYSWFLKEIVEQLKNPKNVDLADAERWSDTLTTFRNNVSICNPIYSSAEIIASLSDEQITQFFDNRAASRESDDESEDDVDADEIFADSTNARVKQIRRYLDLIGLKLNASQLADLRNTMNSTIRPAIPFREMVKDLDNQLVILLDKRKTSNFSEMLVSYFDSRRESITNWRQQVSSHNRNVWQEYTVRTIHSLDSEQRQVALNYLGGLAATIKALAGDKPSFQKYTASEYQCEGKIISN